MSLVAALLLAASDLGDPSAALPTTPLPAPAASVPASPDGAGPVAEPLTLDEVLASVLRTHPRIVQARSLVDVKEAGRVSARGAFDAKLKAQVEAGLGYYDRQGAGVSIEQPLPTFGSPELYGKWRVGNDWPVYEGKNVTGTFGEVEAGLRVQLLRDLLVDEQRFGLQRARLEVLEAEAKQRSVELKVMEDAAKAHTGWALAVQRLRIARELLAIAESRQEFLTRQVAAGALAEIVLVDNQRQIFDRREKVISLERDVENQGLYLSLFLRDANAATVRPSPRLAPHLDDERCSAFPSAIDAESLVDDAIAARPELAALSQVREVLKAELALAENDGLPRVQLEVLASQDLGSPQAIGPIETRPETEAHGRLTFSMPVQRRKARGSAAKARGELRAVDAELGLARDTIRQEVESALNSYRAACARVEIAHNALLAAHRLEEAEREKLAAGGSDLLSVNLREERAAQSAETWASAVAESMFARVVVELRAGHMPSSS